MTAAILVGEAQRRQFEQEGWFVLERVIPDEQLAILRAELDRFLADCDAEMEEKGVDVLGPNHRGKRYFVAARFRDSEPLRDFLFGDLCAEICRATIGDSAYLFFEQFVVKMAEVGLRFSWHQDSGYLKKQIGYTRPYLTQWIALDDMSEDNGTISVLPFSRMGTRDVVDHVYDEDLHDQVGYFGDDPGIPVVVPAGSIVVFSTTLMHRSGANRTARPRRSYVVQFSPEPIMRVDGTAPHLFAEAVLVDGRRTGAAPA